MLKRSITYIDFNDNEVTDIEYFNLTRTELLEMEVDLEGGISATLQKVMDNNDNKELFDWFKKFILMSYGKKSEDGKRFTKSDTLTKEFQETAAYDALLKEMTSSAEAAVTFLTGILPKEFTGNVDIKAATEEAMAEYDKTHPQSAISEGTPTVPTGPTSSPAPPPVPSS